MGLKEKIIKQAEKEETYYNLMMKKAPITFSFIFITTLGLLFITALSLAYYKIKTIPYEGEITCNTEKIGVDFSERFVFNESSTSKDLISFNPQKFDLKGIDGLNCNLKFKGEIPLSTVVRMMRDV